MTTLREIAQQALDALRELLPDERDPNCGGYDARDVRQWRATEGALRAALAQQAEPVERGAAYGDALRWAIKACGALQRDDGVWFGDDAAARLARILSEGISPPQRLPLSNTEMDAALRRAGIVATFEALRCIGRAVERAHGIKE